MKLVLALRQAPELVKLRDACTPERIREAENVIETLRRQAEAMPDNETGRTVAHNYRVIAREVEQAVLPWMGK